MVARHRRRGGRVRGMDGTLFSMHVLGGALLGNILTAVLFAGMKRQAVEPAGVRILFWLGVALVFLLAMGIGGSTKAISFSRPGFVIAVALLVAMSNPIFAAMLYVSRRFGARDWRAYVVGAVLLVFVTWWLSGAR